MLSFDEHPGIMSFLVGIIILVMSAIGLSLVVDRRMKSSSGAVKIQREIETDAMALEALTVVYKQRARLLDESESPLLASSLAGDEVASELEALSKRQTSLTETVGKLRDELGGLEQDFSRYRAEYRRRTREAAIGEELGDFAIRGGREYKGATISRVTDVGLEIRHADGIARIEANELDQAMQDRFQWSDDERRTILDAESQNLGEIASDAGSADSGNSKTPQKLSRGRPLPPRRVPTATEQEELAKLRRVVRGWQVKIRQLGTEKSEAEARDGYGSQASVPGSLETWKGKATRLAREIARARSELAIARSRLAALSPDDPLAIYSGDDP